MFGRNSDRRTLWKVGLGAGIAGGMLMALRYALRPARRGPMPESISSGDFKSKVFHSSHGQIVYHEAGEGPVLLFVHSVCPGASSYEWSKVYPAFVSSHRVIALDLIGFGESERPHREMSAVDQVRTLSEFLAGVCAGERPIFVGSGLGAGLGVMLAAQHPEAISRLLLLMPTGFTEFGRRRLPLGMHLASRIPFIKGFLYRNYLSRRAAVQQWLERFGFYNSELVTEEMVEVFTSCAQQPGADHAIYNLLSGRFSLSLESRLAQVHQPVTLIWADRAVFPPYAWARRFQGMLQTGHLVVVHDAGMLAALEVPEVIVHVLRQELDSTLRLVQLPEHGDPEGHQAAR